MPGCRARSLNNGIRYGEIISVKISRRRVTRQTPERTLGKCAQDSRPDPPGLAAPESYPSRRRRDCGGELHRAEASPALALIPSRYRGPPENHSSLDE